MGLPFSYEDLVDNPKLGHAILSSLWDGPGRSNIVYVPPPASGTETGKDKDTVARAINAALRNPMGGVVVFCSGIYDVGDLSIVLPAYGSGPPIKLMGSLNIATVLWFSIDQGIGGKAVARGATEYDLYFHAIEGIRFLGPGTGGTRGAPPTNTIGGGSTGMDGIDLGSRMQLRYGQCNGFLSGIVEYGNHNEMRTWNCTGNYYGVLFANAYANAGDVLIDACDLSGNNTASIAITKTSVASFTMVKGHLGFGPYCVYFEAGRTAGSGLAMGGTVFNQTSFEQVGNSFFFDPFQFARCQYLTFLQTGNYSRNLASQGITSITTNPGFQVGDWLNVNFIDGFPLGVSDGFLFDVAGPLSMETNQWKASFDASVAAGKSWIVYRNSLPQVRLNEPGYKAVAAQNDTTAAITAGMVLEKGGAGNGYRPWRYYSGANTGPLAGVALNSVSLAGADHLDLVVNVEESDSVPVLVDSAPASAYQLVASTATVGTATGVVYDGTDANTLGRPLIGQTATGVGPVPTGGGTVSCQVRVP